MKFRIITLIAILILPSCSIHKKGDDNTSSKQSSENSNDSVQSDIVFAQNKQLGNDDRYPKVLTYNEIFDKKEELNKYFEDSKKYNSDTSSLKKSLERNFSDYVTTQLKYMLSSELKILRNEFFARKGYKFNSKELEVYFAKYQWYNAHVDDMDRIEFTKIEKAIIDTVKVYEEKNINIDSGYLRKRLRNYFKENLQLEYVDYVIEVPSILFRRNIGYLIKGMPTHNKFWFNGEYLRVEVIDTLKNEILLLGLFGQVDCPDQYCLYGGEIVTCDSLLNYIDSHSIEFEHYDSSIDKNGVIYKFEAPNSRSSKLTLLRIRNNGHIEDVDIPDRIAYSALLK